MPIGLDSGQFQWLSRMAFIEYTTTLGSSINNAWLLIGGAELLQTGSSSCRMAAASLLAGWLAVDCTFYSNLHVAVPQK
jgi:hypothetical protein